MAIDSTRQCTLTNNSGKDIVVTLAVPATETSNIGASINVAGGLEVLKTMDGNIVIKAGSSGTITLDHSYPSSSGSSTYVPHYDLQVCDAEWLVPRAVLPVSQQSNNGTAGFVPQTITVDSMTAMNPAFTFYQTIASYPDSQLAQDYIAALQSAKQTALAKADGSAGAAAAAASAMEDAVNGFFKKGTDYNMLTLADVVAVDTYYNAFPAVWAHYTNSATYYLYGTVGATATAVGTASFIGTLSLKKNGPLDPAKPGGGYMCTFTPAVNSAAIDKWDVDASKAVVLTYAAGLFTDDATAAQPRIALQGSFVLQRFFTMNESDTKPVVIITGNINGALCVGFDAPQQSSNAMKNVTATATDTQGSVVAYWDRLTHPKSLSDWAVTVATFVSAVLAIPAMALASYAVYRAVLAYKTGSRQLTRFEVQFGFDKAADKAYFKDIMAGGSFPDIANRYDLDVMDVINISLDMQRVTAMLDICQKQSMLTKELLKYEAVMERSLVADLNGLIQSLHESTEAFKGIEAPSLYRNAELRTSLNQLIGQQAEQATDHATVYKGLYNKLQERLSQATEELFRNNTGLIDINIQQLKDSVNDEPEEQSDENPKLEAEIEPAALVGAETHV